MPRQDKIFYCYVYLNPLKSGRYSYENYVTFFYEPFYIGKGKQDRLFKHLYDSDGGNKHKLNTINKIKRCNINPIIIKLIDKIFDKCAICHEIYLIKIIGRCDLQTGPLTNLTDGGEGLSGKIFTPEQNAQNSERMRKYFSRPINRKRQSIANTKAWQNEELKKKMELVYKSSERGRKISDKNTGIRKSDSCKRKIRKTIKALWQTHGYRDKMKIAMQKVYDDDKVRDKISLTTKQAMNTPEMKIKMKLIYESPERSRKLKLAWSADPLRKQKASIRQKGNTYGLGRKHTDEEKLKISKSSLGRKHTEQTIKRMSEIKQKYWNNRKGIHA